MKKIIGIIVLTCLILPISVFAATPNISVESGSIGVGETGTIKVTFSGQNLGRVNAALVFDKSKMEYVDGGTAPEGPAKVRLIAAGTGGKMVFTLKFKGKVEGAAHIKVIIREAYDVDESRMENSSPYTGEINVKAPDATGDNGQVATEKEKKISKNTKKNDNEQIHKSYVIPFLIGTILILVVALGIAVFVKKRK